MKSRQMGKGLLGSVELNQNGFFPFSRNFVLAKIFICAEILAKIFRTFPFQNHLTLFVLVKIFSICHLHLLCLTHIFATIFVKIYFFATILGKTNIFAKVCQIMVPFSHVAGMFCFYFNFKKLSKKSAIHPSCVNV